MSTTEHGLRHAAGTDLWLMCLAPPWRSRGTHSTPRQERGDSNPRRSLRRTHDIPPNGDAAQGGPIVTPVAYGRFGNVSVGKGIGNVVNGNGSVKVGSGTTVETIGS